jgi:hypothetical protein
VGLGAYPLVEHLIEHSVTQLQRKKGFGALSLLLVVDTLTRLGLHLTCRVQSEGCLRVSVDHEMCSVCRAYQQAYYPHQKDILPILRREQEAPVPWGDRGDAAALIRRAKELEAQAKKLRAVAKKAGK